MKFCRLLIVAFMLVTLPKLLSPVSAQDKSSATSKTLIIATVQLNRISSRIGYQDMAVLGAPEELKQRLREIAKEESAAQSKILQVKDEGDMQRLQVELRVLAEKKRLFMQAFQTSNSGRDQQKQLKEFIQLKFSEKYPVIVNGESGNSFMSSYNVISCRAETKDITDEVVALLQSEIRGE